MSQWYAEKERKADALKRKKELADATAAERDVKRQWRMEDICNRYSGEEVDKQLGRAIFSTGSALQLAEDPDFKKWAKLRAQASNTYKEPTAEKIGGSILDSVAFDLKVHCHVTHVVRAQHSCFLDSELTRSKLSV